MKLLLSPRAMALRHYQRGDRPETSGPVAVANGLGVDSTAMLVGLVKRGLRPDINIFADTGGEKQETYDFEPIMQEWLRKEGFPAIETVCYMATNFKNWPPYQTLEDNCLTNGTLPGISFGPATCSVKWKHEPQHKLIQSLPVAQRAWADGQRVVKMIGFDAGVRDRIRSYSANPRDAHLYDYQKPLIEWGWDREECVRQIQSVGLPVPPKSSCFFCLAMKPGEVDNLNPAYWRRIVRLEARAHPRLRTTEGLWRSTIKGCRGATPKPGSMTKYIREKRLLPGDEIDDIWNNTPTQILDYQAGYAAAIAAGTAAQFLIARKNDDYRAAA